MNKQLGAMMLALLAVGFTNGEARAQSQALDPKALPPVDFYHHRKKVQYVNEDPEVTNTMRSPEPRKILLLRPPQMQPQQVQYIVAPTASSPGLPPGAVDLSGPPPSGFGSNMPTNPNAFSKRDSLPSGMTTNGLNGQSLLSGRMVPNGGGPSSPQAISAPLHPSAVGPQQALGYKPYNTGTSGASNTQTTSSVSGKLERGSLMGKTK